MKISHQIYIEASIEEVWKKTIDFSNWYLWNPNVNHSKGNYKIYPKIGDTFLLDQPGMGIVSWEIESLNPKKSCSWSAKYKGSTLVATHILSQEEEKVLNHIELDISSGPIKSILNFFLYPLYKLALIRENKGFKESFNSYE